MIMWTVRVFVIDNLLQTFNIPVLVTVT